MQWAVLIGALLLIGCGINTKERVTGGAAAGAASGASVGAFAGPPGAVIGAAIGGGAGAITGAATKPTQLNLGKPPWTNPDAHVGGSKLPWRD
jgi:phage tail tape-measure protein